jgi:hypothetical protein
MSRRSTLRRGLALLVSASSVRHCVDDLEALINASFEATTRVPVEQYLGMHVTRDKGKGFLIIDTRRHVYYFIRYMGYDLLTGPTVSTPLDPKIQYSKEECPQTVNVPLRDKVWAGLGKQIHLETWDLAHSVSVLWRYVHNPSLKLWAAYHRIARISSRLNITAWSMAPATLLGTNFLMDTLIVNGEQILTFAGLRVPISSSSMVHVSAGRYSSARQSASVLKRPSISLFPRARKRH